MKKICIISCLVGVCATIQTAVPAPAASARDSQGVQSSGAGARGTDVAKQDAGARSSGSATAPAASAPLTGAMAPAPTRRLNDPLAIYKQAGIDQDQEQKINNLVKSFDVTLKQKANEMIELMRAMRVLSLQPEPDEKATFAKQEEINRLNNEMATERIRLMLNIRRLLTPAQKQKLVGLMQGNAASTAAGTATSPASPAAGTTASPASPGTSTAKPSAATTSRR